MALFLKKISLKSLGKKALFFGSLGGLTYKASQTFKTHNVDGGVLLDIIRRAYRSEDFYLATWRVKARILARRINYLIPDTPESEISDVIYSILRANKNKQGNIELAKEITNRLLIHF